MPIHVEVVTRDQKVFEEPEADMVLVPGSEGEMGVLPHPDMTIKAFQMFGSMVHMLFAEEEYRDVLYVILGVDIVLLLLMIFIRPLRLPIGLYFAACTVVVFIGLMGIAAKTGHVGAFVPRRRRSGGRFSGRSAGF